MVSHFEEPQPVSQVFYVLFAKQWELTRNTAADLAVPMVNELDAVLRAQCPPPMWLPSPYGGVVLFHDLPKALKAAKHVISGVKNQQISVAITRGRLDRTSWFGLPNYAGPDLNLAARIASLDQVKKRVAVAPEVAKEISLTFTDCQAFWQEEKDGEVKDTLFRYLLVEDDEYRQRLAAGNSHPPAPQGGVFSADIVIFDIQKYSGKSPEEQTNLSRELGLIAEGAYQNIAVERLYGPAGDGGYAVFRCERSNDSIAVAYSYARGVQSSATQKGIPLRVAIARGSVAESQHRKAVGGSILQADNLCSLGYAGGMSFDLSWRLLPEAMQFEIQQTLEQRRTNDKDVVLLAPKHTIPRRPAAIVPSGAVVPRRSLFLWVVGLLTYYAGSRRFLNWLVDTVYDKRGELLESRRPTSDRLKLLAAILKPAGDLVYSTAKSHLKQLRPEVALRWLKTGLPHDRVAIAAFACLEQRTPTRINGECWASDVPAGASLVAAGSPVSSDDARIYLPHYRSEEPHTVVSEKFRPERIPYHFAMGTEERIWVRSAMEEGKLTLKRDCGLKMPGRSGPWRPRQLTDKQGRLATDFLLVTRLPRGSEAGDIILITGGHGPGSEAFSLLLDEDAFPDSELRRLADYLGGARYFQFVLEAYDISHEGKMSIASRIRISDDCPPQVIKDPNTLFKQSSGPFGAATP